MEKKYRFKLNQLEKRKSIVHSFYRIFEPARASLTNKSGRKATHMSEAYSESSETYKMERLAEIVNG